VLEVARPFLDHPLVKHVKSPATCLWENWTEALRAADTEFFGWLQDDDIVTPFYSQRAIRALDRHKDSVVWLARLGISTSTDSANWWQATGPMVPMDLIGGGTTEIYSSLIVAGAWFTSWALSPGVVFRRTPETVAAVERVPNNSDLYAERTVLAQLCQHGHACCDPAIVGYWVMHEGNESRRQLSAGDAERQFHVMGAEVDALMRRCDWEQQLGGWAMLIGLENVKRYLEDTAQHAGKYETLDRAREILGRLVPDAVPTPEPEPEPVEHAINGKAKRASRAVVAR
jgi:hypothetical protein